MPDPEYKISVQSGYVLVEDPPNYDVVWIEQPPKLQAISAACSEAGYRKVLIRESNANVRLTVTQIFNLGKDVGKLGLKIAMVSTHDASQENERLLENTASNRGLPIRFFDNAQDARNWLGV